MTAEFQFGITGDSRQRRLRLCVGAWPALVWASLGPLGGCFWPGSRVSFFPACPNHASRESQAERQRATCRSRALQRIRCFMATVTVIPLGWSQGPTTGGPSSSPVFQAGAGDVGGVEIAGELGDLENGSFRGSAGPRLALGAYGAFGYQGTKTVATDPMFC